MKAGAGLSGVSGISSLTTEVLIIGSGAGGAVSAALLAEAGRTVTVVEEGSWLDPDDCEPFSLEELVTKYRNQGLSAALGTPGVAYAEGRCVGGGTEINSGLYRRLPHDLAEGWARRYQIADFDAATLDRYAADVEDYLGVSRLPGPPPPTQRPSA